MQRQMLRMILHSARRHPQLPNHNPQVYANNGKHHNTITATTNRPKDSKRCKRRRQRHLLMTCSPRPIDEDITERFEPWGEWIQRCTHDVEAIMRTLKLEVWIVMQRRRKWRWASKLANTTQYDPTLDPRLAACRRPGRPKTRWADDIRIPKYRQQCTTQQNYRQQVRR